MARSLAGISLALALVVLAGLASGQSAPRVATGPFAGQHENSARDAVDSALTHHDGQGVEVLPALDFIAAQQRLGLENAAGDEDVLRVARDQHVDFVVVGSMTHRARTWVMRLRVLSGRDGATLGTASWELRSPSEAADVRDEIWQQLSPYVLGTAGSPRAGAIGSGGNAADRAGSARVGRGPAPTGPPATSSLGFLALALGAGDAMRFWRLSVLGEMAARGYDNHGFVEAAGRGTLLYRWANDRAGVGVSVGGSLPVAIASRGFDATGAAVTLPTHAFEVWGGFAAAYRPPTGGWTVLNVGVFDQSFAVDTSQLPAGQQLAPMSYIGLRLEAEGAVPLYADAVAGWEFDAIFGAQLRVAAVGPEVRSEFGDAPGTTLALGGEAGLALLLDGWLPGLAVRATGELVRYRTPFAGRYRVGPASDSIDDFVRIQGALVYAFGVARPGRAR